MNVGSDALRPIAIDLLQPHPNNPRLVIRRSIVEHLSMVFKEKGFDPAHAIIARPMGEFYQVVSGHQRLEGARDAGLASVPTWVRNLTDEEAYMMLLTANTQSELSPLEVGYHAMTFGNCLGGKGVKGGVNAYARSIGRDPASISHLISAARVASECDVDKELLLHRAYHLHEVSQLSKDVWSHAVARMVKDEWSAETTKERVRVAKQYVTTDEMIAFFCGPVAAIAKGRAATGDGKLNQSENSTSNDVDSNKEFPTQETANQEAVVEKAEHPNSEDANATDIEQSKTSLSNVATDDGKPASASDSEPDDDDEIVTGMWTETENGTVWVPTGSSEDQSLIDAEDIEGMTPEQLVVMAIDQCDGDSLTVFELFANALSGQPSDVIEQVIRASMAFMDLEGKRDIAVLTGKIFKEATKGTTTAGRKLFIAPSIAEVKAYCEQRRNNVDHELFHAHYSANGWRQANGNPIKNWKASVVTWEKGNDRFKNSKEKTTDEGKAYLDRLRKAGEQGQAERAKLEERAKEEKDRKDKEKGDKG